MLDLPRISRNEHSDFRYGSKPTGPGVASLYHPLRRLPCIRIATGHSLRTFVSRLNPTSPQPELSWAGDRLAKTHGSVPVQRLADEIGYSRRHFTERFRDAVGVAPKLAARVFRFERACRLIADRRSSLARVAIACGYYDQAHLIHEWYALA